MVAGGCEQDVEAGVSVAAHDPAVQPEAAGDLAQRVADVDHPVDLLVVPYDPVHDQGRRLGLLCWHPRPGPLGAFGILPQAGAMLMAGPLHCERGVAHQVPAICHFDCLRGGFFDGPGMGTCPVTAHHLDPRVIVQPSDRRLGCPVRKDVDRMSALDIDNDGSVTAVRRPTRPPNSAATYRTTVRARSRRVGTQRIHGDSTVSAPPCRMAVVPT